MLHVGWDGWMDWIGSQTICTARAPLSGANNNNGDDKDYNGGDDYYNPTRSLKRLLAGAWL